MHDVAVCQHRLHGEQLHPQPGRQRADEAEEAVGGPCAVVRPVPQLLDEDYVVLDWRELDDPEVGGETAKSVLLGRQKRLRLEGNSQLRKIM